MQVDAGVTSVAISPDGRLVAAGSLDTIVRLWDVQTGQLIERLVGHKDSVYSVAFTPDGKGLVSGSLDQTLKHWDLGPLLRSTQRGAPLRQPYEGAAGIGGAVVKKEGGTSEKGCACTVNFTGHKVSLGAVLLLSLSLSLSGYRSFFHFSAWNSLRV